MKVYRVLAPSYSGATMLSCLASWHPRVTGFGDTYLSASLDYSKSVCTCGAPLLSCPLRAEINKLMGTAGHPIKSIREWEPFWDHGTENAFLHAIERAADVDVYVDGSKRVGRARTFDTAGVIQVVKSPFEYVQSYRHYFNADATAEYIATDWCAYHEDVDNLDRVPVASVVYEDFVRHPAEHMSGIWRALGVGDIGLPAVSTTHVIGHSSVLKFAKTGDVYCKPERLYGGLSEEDATTVVDVIRRERSRAGNLYLTGARVEG